MTLPASEATTGVGAPFPVARLIQENLKDLHDNWFWFLILGVGLAILGAVAVSYSIMASIATAVVFGFFLLLGGVFYIVGAFLTRSGWGGLFLNLLAGVLHLALGVIVLNHPAEALLVYTLLLAVFFLVEGMFRIVAALAGRFRHWEWVLLNGFITLALGVLIWRQWPLSGLYVVGLFLGINMIVSGASYINLALSARRLPV